jgi:class 3 adenylate cyclase
MDVLNAALRAQLAIRGEIWDSCTPIRVRIALHTGEVIERNNEYYGPALSQTARLKSIGYGGQTFVSLGSTELERDMLPDDVGLMELGQRRLEGLTRAESVYQLTHPSLEEEFPSLESIDLNPHNLPVQQTTLIGRETSQMLRTHCSCHLASHQIR